MRDTIGPALLTMFVVACPAPPVGEGEGESPAGGEGEGEPVGEGEGEPVGEGEGEPVGEGEGESVGEGEGEPAVEGEGEPVGEGEGESSVFVSDGDAYAPGPLAVSSFVVELDGVDEAVFVAAPTIAGRYAMVQFQHGFSLLATDYAGALEQLASHGFVVVAPQMYTSFLNAPLAAAEAERAVALLSELPGRLADELDSGVVIADVVGLAGHSRGGKVIWSMLSANDGLADAVFGLDPVDGAVGFGDTRVIDGDFNFQLPTMIVGSGLGGTCTGFFCQPCAPIEDNHDAFFAASASPATHVVATDLGHNDFLDDTCGFECGVCESSEDLMPPVSSDIAPAYAGGLMAAFFRATLQGDDTALAIALDPTNAPVVMTVEQR